LPCLRCVALPCVILSAPAGTAIRTPSKFLLLPFIIQVLVLSISVKKGHVRTVLTIYPCAVLTHSKDSRRLPNLFAQIYPPTTLPLRFDFKKRTRNHTSSHLFPLSIPAQSHPLTPATLMPSSHPLLPQVLSRYTAQPPAHSPRTLRSWRRSLQTGQRCHRARRRNRSGASGRG